MSADAFRGTQIEAPLEGGYMNEMDDGMMLGDGDNQMGHVRRNVKDYGLRPLSIKQILNAPLPGPDQPLQIDGKEVSNLTIVGVIRNIIMETTHTTYQVEGPTGASIDVTRWSSDGRDLVQADDLETNIYVRVIGRVRTFQGKKAITAFTIIKIEDFDEITYHRLDAMKTHFVNVMEMNDVQNPHVKIAYERMKKQKEEEQKRQSLQNGNRFNSNYSNSSNNNNNNNNNFNNRNNDMVMTGQLGNRSGRMGFSNNNNNNNNNSSSNNANNGHSGNSSGMRNFSSPNRNLSGRSMISGMSGNFSGRGGFLSGNRSNGSNGLNGLSGSNGSNLSSPVRGMNNNSNNSNNNLNNNGNVNRAQDDTGLSQLQNLLLSFITANHPADGTSGVHLDTVKSRFTSHSEEVILQAIKEMEDNGRIFPCAEDNEYRVVVDSNNGQ